MDKRTETLLLLELTLLGRVQSNKMSEPDMDLVITKAKNLEDDKLFDFAFKYGVEVKD